MDQLIINSINLATKPNQQPQTPTKLSPRFKSLARECGFVFWEYRDWETDRKSTRLNSSH